VRVDLHPEARAEFRSAALWYEERRDGLGVEFVAALDAALLRIGKAPKSFPQWVGTEQAPAVIRKASVEGFPYVTRASATALNCASPVQPALRGRPDFQVHVEGTPRDLAPFHRHETYRTAIEAVRNAFRHAHAGRIGVEIPYSQRQLRLRFRDNGKPSTRRSSTETGRTGTTACLAMHERARAVGGKLAVWSELDSGTEAGLTIPASIAYAKSPVARWPMSSGKET